jgi:hypothetical protein
MHVEISQPAAIAIQTLGTEDRRNVMAWFDHLANWKNDSFVRERAHRLSKDDRVYVLRTSSDIRIFFSFEEDRIVILDIARTAALQSFVASTE